MNDRIQINSNENIFNEGYDYYSEMKKEDPSELGFKNNYDSNDGFDLDAFKLKNSGLSKVDKDILNTHLLGKNDNVIDSYENEDLDYLGGEEINDNEFSEKEIDYNHLNSLESNKEETTYNSKDDETTEMLVSIPDIFDDYDEKLPDNRDETNPSSLDDIRSIENQDQIDSNEDVFHESKQRYQDDIKSIENKDQDFTDEAENNSNEEYINYETKENKEGISTHLIKDEIDSNEDIFNKEYDDNSDIDLEIRNNHESDNDYDYDGLDQINSYDDITQTNDYSEVLSAENYNAPDFKEPENENITIDTTTNESNEYNKIAKFAKEENDFEDYYWTGGNNYDSYDDLTSKQMDSGIDYNTENVHEDGNISQIKSYTPVKKIQLDPSRGIKIKNLLSEPLLKFRNTVDKSNTADNNDEIKSTNNENHKQYATHLIKHSLWNTDR